jgi:hypothetical protein
MVLTELDWKKSKFYGDYAVNKLNIKTVFELDMRYLKEDEIDYVKMMVKNRVHGIGPFSDEVKRICEPLIMKAQTTIEVMLKELLQESFYQFDKIVIEKTFGGNFIL